MVEFRVLRCAECQTFQVLQVTKSQKWKCKLCGNKQSVIKVYGCGTGAECRRHVQKLNTLRGELDLIQEEASFLAPASSLNLEKGNPIKIQAETSQWAKFMSSTSNHGSDDEDGNDIASTDRVCVTTDRTLFEAERKQAKYNKRRMPHKDESYSQQSSSWKCKRYSQGSDNSYKAMNLNKPVKSSPFLPQECVTSHKQSSFHSPNKKSSSYQSSLHSFNRQFTSHQSSLHSLNTNRQQERDMPLALRKNSWENTQSASIQSTFHHEILRPKTDAGEPDSGEQHPLMSKDKDGENNMMTFQASKSPNCKTKTMSSHRSNFSSHSSKWAAFLDDDLCDIETGEDDELDPNDYGQLTVFLPACDYSNSKPF